MVSGFLKKKLEEFYLKHPVRPPYRFQEREFGFGNEKKIDYRHFSFKNSRDLQNYFVSNAPLYASFSVAYYEFPGARPMPKKMWKGADLIFEFDSDVQKLTDEEALEKAKRDSFYLIEEFLMKDFGISKSEVEVAFSGNRGYHIYVRNDEVKKLNSLGRREVSEYVMGIGLDVKRFISKKEVDPVGWGRRFRDAAIEYVKNSNRKAFKTDEDKQYAIDQIMKGNYDVVRGFESDIQKQLEKMKANITSQIDQGVTLDVSRLIRMPSTIHGGSSLLCDYVDLTKLESYNPFRDAVVFGSEEVKVKVLEDVEEFVLKEQSFGPLKKEQEIALPEFAALFLIAKKKAIENF